MNCDNSLKALFHIQLFFTHICEHLHSFNHHIFSELDKFTETEELSQSETLISSSFEDDEESSSNVEISSIQTIDLNDLNSSNEFDEYSSDIGFALTNITDEFVVGGDGDGNQNKSRKGNNIMKICIIACIVVAVVVVLAIIEAVAIVKKWKIMNSNSNGDVVETQDSTITANNGHHELMDKDDLFDEEFHEDSATGNTEKV